MRKIYILILICLTAVLCSSSVLAQLSATVDRDQLALDETLTLSIRKDSRGGIPSTTLQPLNKDFRVMGQSQNSNTQFINGSISSSFTLNVVLAPKRAGKLEIPPLSVGKERTDRLYVKVVTQGQPKTRADSEPLYIETEVSDRTVLVQSELIFTLRIFWAIEASILQPADPQLQDALMERLNDASYNKVINGQTYKVFERKYAIFPQKSGRLEIPQIIVQATIPIRQGHVNRFDLFGTRGKEVKLRSEREVITVREKSLDYPAGAEWLPTDKLTIAEEWSREPGDLRVGESVTITIAMAAQGLLGAQLPLVELSETEGVKLYQGKAEVQSQTTSSGVTGHRKESIALIPMRVGKVELPATRIPWWNKKRQKVEYATVPARELLVKPSLSVTGKTKQVTATVDHSELPGAQPIPRGLSASMAQLNRPLIVLCVFLVIAWLLTIYMLLRARHQLSLLHDEGQLEETITAAANEREAFKTLGRACRRNDPALARKAAFDWARAFRPGEMVQTVGDLERIFADDQLAVLLYEIDNILYNQDEDQLSWRGESLYLSVESIKKTASQEKKNKAVLQELYK
jgi:hypothetical protein